MVMVMVEQRGDIKWAMCLQREMIKNYEEHEAIFLVMW
jgi:hypothetical protein